MLDLEVIGDGIADLVLDAVRRATAPLHKQIAELQARAPAQGEKGEKGDSGDAGRDGIAPSTEDLRPMVIEAVSRALSEMPPPKDGAPGEKGDPGRDAEPVSNEKIVDAVARWLEANPPPAGRDGEPGERGEPGLSGADGKDGADGRDGAPGPQGERGDAGQPGETGVTGEKGDPGRDGADGTGLAGALIDRAGNLIVTLTDGTTRDLGPVEGKDGRHGIDGQQGPPGFSLEDFDSEVRDGGRTLLLSFTAGDTKHTVEHQLDTMIYRGAYKADQEYLPGDTTSCGGQLYHCNTQTSARPDGGSEAWTLCSRRGRDGKDADPAPLLRLIEDKFSQAEDSLMKRVEAFLRSKGV
jgi:hypothetical protein